MLILANVRERWSSFLGAFIAVLVGVALITTTLVIYDSARATTQARYEGTAAMVLPQQALDVDGSTEDRMPWSKGEAAPLVAGLDQVPGVGAVVVDRSFYAQAFKNGEPVTDEGAAESGHGYDSVLMAPYGLVSGRPPHSGREVVVDNTLGAAVGSELTVNIAEGRKPFTVVGTVDGPGFYFSESFAAQQQPGVRAIGLVAAKGADTGVLVDAVKKVVGDKGDVVTGDGRAELQPQYIEHKRFLGVQLISAMALLGLFTTVFVVASMLVLATGMRRREIGLLRSIGASPQQIKRMILGEAAVVGLLGSIAGCAAGVAAAPLLRDILNGLDVTPPGMRVTVAAWPLLTGCAVGIGVSVIGAWTAGRKAAAVAPIEALLNSRSPNNAMSRGRWAAGLAVLGAGALLAGGTATSSADHRINMAIFATMTLIVAAALLTPAFIGPVGRFLTAPFQRGGSAGPVLIRAELVANPRRAASLVAPVIAAVGFAVLLSGMVETMRVAYPAGEALKVAGQTIVTPDGTPGNTDEVVTANPVGKAALPTRAFATTDQIVLDVLGSRDQRWSKPGAAVLGKHVASDLGVKQGESVPVRFADGATVTLRISQVLPDDPARGDFVVARDLVRAHDPAALTDDIFVPGDAQASGAVPGTALHDAAEYALADYETDAKLTDSLAMMLIVIAVGYSVVAVVNSMAMAAHGRRRDFGVMKSAGGTDRQLLLTAMGETFLIIVIGAAFGVLVTLPPLAGMASGLSQANSSGTGLHLSTGTLTIAILGTLVAAVLAGVAVTAKTLRRQAA
ncbi:MULTISPECIES: ABC transporter permease [unclassified Streptomyces]|uniref:ABC transporter permease n=1 Tax=unclassified Streptomyces TaxID=2593676 RepID=UPI000DB923AA|nr:MULTISPECIES: ABC transporter permease [unclassified Streptomyces]MYT73407.1 FtsX-like permease family protein [Streptomyces sp. SID8367]RAJ84934.1 putative ABC transport system permease protein [Streptomyces sp. PsTaAH-137]